MAEAGHEVIACAPDDGEAGITTALDGIGVGFRDIPMARTGTNPFADLRTLSAYVRLMRRERPDVGLAYTRSEERCVGKGCVGTCRARGAQYQKRKKNKRNKRIDKK